MVEAVGEWLASNFYAGRVRTFCARITRARAGHVSRTSDGWAAVRAIGMEQCDIYRRGSTRAGKKSTSGIVDWMWTGRWSLSSGESRLHRDSPTRGNSKCPAESRGYSGDAGGTWAKRHHYHGGRDNDFHVWLQ